MENEKISKTVKFVVFIFSALTMIPNIIPLIRVLPGIYAMEIDYMEDIHLTVYCLLGVFIPFVFILKSKKIAELISYKLTYKDDFTEVIKFIGIFIIILATVLIVKVSYYDGYTYYLKYDRIINALVGVVIYFKADKVNILVLTYYKKAKDRMNVYKDEYDKYKNNPK